MTVATTSVPAGPVGRIARTGQAGQAASDGRVTSVGEDGSVGHGGTARVRVAIVSPDILAQIRQVFARKNLAVEIVRLPYVEVVVGPAAAPVAVVSGGVPGAVPGAARGPGPESVRERGADDDADGAAPPARRLCAEYRLSAIAVDSAPAGGHPAPDVRPPHPAGAPAPASVSGGAEPSAALSRRQHEVMALMSRGARNAEIAARLGVSEKTVKNHINRIFRTLGAGSRIEAVLIWQRDRRDDTVRRGPLALVPAAVPEPTALP